MAAELVLRADRVSMQFGRRVLFHGLSFAVQPGEALAVVGPNGAGKSTLLKILAGVLKPTGGEVMLQSEGQRISDERRAGQIGFVAPYLGLYDAFTARENLEFLARARGLDDAERRVGEQLDRVGLYTRADDPVARFSTGMRQRLRLAAAFLHDPPVLLLDEPSAALDEKGRELVYAVIANQNKGIVVATNDPDESSRCADTLRLQSTHLES